MLKLLSEVKEVFCFYLKLVVRVGVVSVDEVVGGEGVRADGGTTGVQGFLCEEEEVGKKGRCGGKERKGRRREERLRKRGKEKRGRRRGKMGKIKPALFVHCRISMNIFSDGSYPIYIITPIKQWKVVDSKASWCACM